GVRSGTALRAIFPLAAAPAQAKKRHHHHHSKLSIVVLSGRSDLVTGGSALVAIKLPRASDARHLKVKLGHQSVRGDFAFRADGQFEGLLTGLKDGPTVLRAILR